jgi:hypothetical protein
MLNTIVQGKNPGKVVYPILINVLPAFYLEETFLVY